MANQATQKLYRVRGIQPTMIYQESGPPVEGQRIDFSVAGAGDQYIMIPNSDFDPAQIDEQVADWAAKIAGVLSLEGPDVEIDSLGRPVPPGTVAG